MDHLKQAIDLLTEDNPKNLAWSREWNAHIAAANALVDIAISLRRIQLKLELEQGYTLSQLWKEGAGDDAEVKT
jgi:hypothetical protein